MGESRLFLIFIYPNTSEELKISAMNHLRHAYRNNVTYVAAHNDEQIRKIFADGLMNGIISEMGTRVDRVLIYKFGREKNRYAGITLSISSLKSSGQGDGTYSLVRFLRQKGAYIMSTTTSIVSYELLNEVKRAKFKRSSGVSIFVMYGTPSSEGSFLTTITELVKKGDLPVVL